jgi:hypothetical protein
LEANQKNLDTSEMENLAIAFDTPQMKIVAWIKNT